MKYAIVVGMMNFSVLFKNTSAYKASRKEYLEYKNDILDLDRLKVREDIFFSNSVELFLKVHSEYLTKGIVFRFNIAITDQLPPALMTKFNSLATTHKNIFNIIKVKEDEPHNWRDIIEEDILACCEKYEFSDDVLIYNFRLDDDDLLSKSYFNKLESYLKSDYSGFYLTFSKGYVSLYDNGYKEFYQLNRPYLAIGLAKISTYSNLEKKFLTEDPIVMSRSHTSLVSNSMTILDSTIFAYVWTMHLFSDTRSLDKDERQSKKKIYDYLNSLGVEKEHINNIQGFFKKGNSYEDNLYK